MYEADIRKCISELIDKNRNANYVVYPYGTVGLLVEDILNKVFGIKPEYIVDNKVCKYNSRVISFEQFRDANKLDKNLVIIVSTEYESLSQTLKNELVKTWNKEQVFTLLDEINSFREKEFIHLFGTDKSAVDLDSLLPESRYYLGDKSTKRRIKVRFIDTNGHLFLNIKMPIAEALADDPNYDVCFVINAYAEKEPILKSLNDKGMHYCFNYMYSISDDKPDVVIVSYMFVVICTISMFDDVRKWNRDNIVNYKEIYIRVPFDILKVRDQKGLYSGKTFERDTTVAGVDFEFEEPKIPDLILDNDGSKTPEELAEYIIGQISNERVLNN